MSPGIVYFVHPERLSWRPIEWTNPTPEQVQTLKDDGWQDVDRATYTQWRRAWRARTENSGPPPAA